MRHVTTLFAAASIASIVLLPRLARADGAPSPEPTGTPPSMTTAAPARRVIVLHDEPPLSRVRSEGLVIGGAAVGAAGAALLIGGISMVQAARDTPPCTNRELTIAAWLGGSAGALACASVTLGDETRRAGGITTAAFGGLGLAGGVAMIVVGAMPVTSPTRGPTAKGLPAVAVGPASASLTWRF